MSSIYRISTCLLTAVGLVLWLSLRPSPHLEEIHWLPPWLTHWADQNGNLRTAVPFFVLSFYIGLEACLGFPKSRSLPALMWLLGAYGLFALLVLSEIAQIAMPTRYFDWQDLGWGFFGILLGSAPVVVRGLFLRPRTPNLEPSD